VGGLEEGMEMRGQEHCIARRWWIGRNGVDILYGTSYGVVTYGRISS
jgi:hypothetical protein